MVGGTPPSVSVVIPVYNGEQFLADAIQSVLDQTYQNFEVIVVDDGSTDGSAAVAKRFGEAIRYVHQANGGVCKARNTGIAAARGAYLAFLDQDDLWLPDKLAVQVAYLDSHPVVGAVYCQCQVLQNPEAASFDRAKIKDPGSSYRSILSTLYYERPVKDDVVGIMKGPYLLMTATMFRTEVLRKIGGFDDALSGAGYEDGDLTLRLIDVARISFLHEILAQYRVHATNSMKNEWGILRNCDIYLRKCRDRYAHNAEIGTLIYSQRFEYHAYVGRLQIQAGRHVEGQASLQEANLCLSTLRQRLENRLHDRATTKFWYHVLVGHYSNLSKIQVRAGCAAEARVSLREAIRLSVRQRTNAKMFTRSLRRLVRSYFPF